MPPTNWNKNCVPRYKRNFISFRKFKQWVRVDACVCNVHFGERAVVIIDKSGIFRRYQDKALRTCHLDIQNIYYIIMQRRYGSLGSHPERRTTLIVREDRI